MARRRQVTDEEQALWRTVTRSVSPLRRHRKEAKLAPDQADPAAKPATRPPPQHPVATQKPTPKSAPKPKEPALEPFDRRSKQKLVRGTQAIDARLDLHGYRQSEAHAALLRFLHRQQTKGAKTVLVITGKGGSPDGGRGVLKRQVPMWLESAEMRTFIVGFESAGIGHGGTGALYVRLRRGR